MLRRHRATRVCNHLIDDCSRLAYSEILANEKKNTVAAFWIRARAVLADAGITVRAVMTDSQFYGHDRPHIGIGSLVPTDRVRNLTRN